MNLLALNGLDISEALSRNIEHLDYDHTATAQGLDE